MDANFTYTAFENGEQLFSGRLVDVVLKIKKRIGKSENSPIQVFSDSTGNTMDFNFQGTEKEVLKRLEPFMDAEVSAGSGPGRPKLGVVSREVSLLPGQWEWLATQSGGASSVLRNLVDEAKRKTQESMSIKLVQERTYKFMSAVAGNLKGYEEALRALYRKDEANFKRHISDWPSDVKTYSLKLSAPIFSR